MDEEKYIIKVWEPGTAEVTEVFRNLPLTDDEKKNVIAAVEREGFAFKDDMCIQMDTGKYICIKVNEIIFGNSIVEH